MKKTNVFCDICGDEIKLWYGIKFYIESLPGYEYINVSDMLKYNNIKCQICKNCFDKIFMKI